MDMHGFIICITVVDFSCLSPSIRWYESPIEHLLTLSSVDFYSAILRFPELSISSRVLINHRTTYFG